MSATARTSRQTLSGVGIFSENAFLNFPKLKGKKGRKVGRINGGGKGGD